MAGFIQWASGNVQSIDLTLSGQGAQITNGASLAATNTLNNTGVSGGPAFFAMVELVASESGFGANVFNNVPVNLYMAPSLDGTASGTATMSVSGQPMSMFRGSFLTPVSGNVSRCRMVVEGIPLMPYEYTVFLNNGTGQTLTSGWTLSAKLHVQAYT